jgi:DNA-directed RNA polymerase subunit RPC12/RpoP
MVKIECLICGKSVKIPSYIDPDDYDGEINCQNCTSRLYVRLVQSKVKKFKVVEKNSKGLEKLLEDLQRLGK